MFNKKEKIKKEYKLSELIKYLINQNLELQELAIDRIIELLSIKSSFTVNDIGLLIYMLSIKEFKYLVLEFLSEFPINEIEPYIIGIYLHDNDYLNRVEACEALLSLDKNYDDLFFMGMNDSSQLVRAYSVDSLSNDINSNIFNKLLELEKSDRSLIVKVSCRKKLFLLTKDKKWIKKIYKNIKSKNYRVAIWAIRSIEEVIEEGLLNINEIKDFILKANKDEKRVSVKSNLENFIELYIK